MHSFITAQVLFVSTAPSYVPLSKGSFCKLTNNPGRSSTHEQDEGRGTRSHLNPQTKHVLHSPFLLLHRDPTQHAASTRTVLRPFQPHALGFPPTDSVVSYGDDEPGARQGFLGRPPRCARRPERGDLPAERGRARNPPPGSTALRSARTPRRYLFSCSSLRISRSSAVSSISSSSSTPAREGATTTSPKNVAIASASPPPAFLSSAGGHRARAPSRSAAPVP